MERKFGLKYSAPKIYGKRRGTHPYLFRSTNKKKIMERPLNNLESTLQVSFQFQLLLLLLGILILHTTTFYVFL
jgi:hypothetical protein